jgi:hypothetical protein
MKAITTTTINLTTSSTRSIQTSSQTLQFWKCNNLMMIMMMTMTLTQAVIMRVWLTLQKVNQQKNQVDENTDKEANPSINGSRAMMKV